MPVQKLVTWLCGMVFAGLPPMVGEAAAPTVDLAVSEIIPSATEPPKVLVIIRNLGSQPLKRAVEVELWLDDQLLGRQHLDETLKPREPVYVEFARPVPMPPGLHNFTAKVDPDHAIRELSETNNERDLTVWGHDAP